jgi:outer membrane immunogenic protein
LGELTMKNSKLILSAAVAIGAIMNVAAVSAADFRAFPYAKAPPMVPIDPLISWAGFYAGVNVGGLWAHSDIRDVDAYASAAIPGTVTAINRSGFLGGGQVGYNWQASNYLFGIEVDGGYMDLGGTTPLTGTRSGTRVGLRSGAYGDFTGRVGVTFNRAFVLRQGRLRRPGGRIKLQHGQWFVLGTEKIRHRFRIHDWRRSGVQICAELERQGRIPAFRFWR